MTEEIVALTLKKLYWNLSVIMEPFWLTNYQGCNIHSLKSWKKNVKIKSSFFSHLLNYLCPILNLCCAATVSTSNNSSILSLKAAFTAQKLEWFEISFLHSHLFLNLAYFAVSVASRCPFKIRPTGHLPRGLGVRVVTTPCILSIHQTTRQLVKLHNF